METAEAALRCNAMWARLGRIFERKAYKIARELKSRSTRDTSLAFARLAEGCFFHATGDMNCFDVGEPA
jgi:hypothetical protein